MSESESSYWWIGVLCSLLACVGTVSGLMMQKWSHMKNEVLPIDQQKPSYRRPLWWLSLFLMIIVPSPLDVASLALAPQSLLAPLAAVTLLLNALLSPCFLGEVLTRVDVYATILIFIGAGLTTTFGDHSEHTYDVPGLYDLFSRAEFIVFQVLSMILFVFLWWYFTKFIKEKKEWESQRQEFREVKANENENNNETLESPMLVEENRINSSISLSYTPFKYRVLPFVCGALAGLAGAQQNTITKSVSELIAVTIRGDGNEFVYALTYVLAALGIFFAIFQISYVSRGLEHFDAIFYLPIYNAFLIVLGIIAGSVYFNEVKHLSAYVVSLFILGVSITIGGVLLLSKREPRGGSSGKGLLKISTSDDIESSHFVAAPLSQDGIELQSHNIHQDNVYSQPSSSASTPASASAADLSRSPILHQTHTHQRHHSSSL